MEIYQSIPMGHILFSLINTKHEKTAKVLLEELGKDFIDPIENFPLTLSIAANKDVLKFLFDNNYNFELVCPKSGCTPLMASICKNDIEAFEFLISINQNVNKGNKELQTPLHFASNFNNAHIIELLIKHKANINAVDKDGNTPLMAAMYIPAIITLIDAGVDVNIKNIEGKTIFDMVNPLFVDHIKSLVEKRNKNNEIKEKAAKYDQIMKSIEKLQL